MLLKVSGELDSNSISPVASMQIKKDQSAPLTSKIHRNCDHIWPGTELTHGMLSVDLRVE